MNRPTTSEIAYRPGAPTKRHALMQAAAVVAAAALVLPAAVAVRADRTLTHPAD